MSNNNLNINIQENNGQYHNDHTESEFTNSLPTQENQQLQQQKPINKTMVQVQIKNDNNSSFDGDHDEEKSIKTYLSTNSEDDEHYSKFSHTRRNIMCVIISISSITAPMTTTIVYPITDALIENFGTTESVVDACLSMFLILAGVVPLGWASFSDVYGRRPVYFTSMIIFILSCIGSILANNMTTYFIMRCFQAIGSSAVLAIGAGSISDIFPISVRGRAMGMYFCGPLLGPSLGPIIGGILVDNFGWRSIFYFLSIIDTILFILINVFLPETMRNASPIFGKDGLLSCLSCCCRCNNKTKKSSSASTASETSGETLSIEQKSTIGMTIDNSKYENSSINSSSNTNTNTNANIAAIITSTVTSNPTISPKTTPVMTPTTIITTTNTLTTPTSDPHTASNLPTTPTTPINNTSSTLPITAFSIPTPTTATTTTTTSNTLTKTNSFIKNNKGSCNSNSKNNNKNKNDENNNNQKVMVKKSFPNPLDSVKYLRYPFVTFVIMYICAVYGMSYCLTSSLPKIYSKEPYSFSSTVVGILYIGFGMGMCMGSLTGGYDSDRLIKSYLKNVTQQRKRIIDFCYNFSNNNNNNNNDNTNDNDNDNNKATTSADNTNVNSYPNNNSEMNEKKNIDTPTNHINITINTDGDGSINSNHTVKVDHKTEHHGTLGNAFHEWCQRHGHGHGHNHINRSKSGERSTEKWQPTKIPPEYRLKNTYYGSIAMIAGLLIHGWSVQNGIFVLVPLLGQLIIGFGQMYTFSITSTYLIEIFPLHSASVTSLNNCLRSIFAALTTYIYSPAVKSLGGTGIPFTILAALIGCTFSLLYYVSLNGSKLRHKHSEWQIENVNAKKEYDEFLRQNEFTEKMVSKYFE